MAALCVIHNTASCLSLYGCGISKIYIFTFYDTHFDVCTPEHMHLCTCTTHLLLQHNNQKGEPKCCPHISHLNKRNRIWYSSRNRAYPHPHSLLTSETHRCWVWNGATKGSSVWMTATTGFLVFGSRSRTSRDICIHGGFIIFFHPCLLRKWGSNRVSSVTITI